VSRRHGTEGVQVGTRPRESQPVVVGRADMRNPGFHAAGPCHKDERRRDIVMIRHRLDARYVDVDDVAASSSARLGVDQIGDAVREAMASARQGRPVAPDQLTGA
jgi:hypothetical protein